MDDQDYTPETLRNYAHRLDDMHGDMLFDVDGSGADPESEQFFLLALESLSMARRYMSLAALKQSRALAGTR